jgi:HK97 gp10 family phage protein
VRVRAKFEGRAKVMARLRNIVPGAEANLAVAQLEAAKELASAIRTRAPVDTGTYRNSIQGDRLASRPAGRRVGGRLKATRVGKELSATKDPNATGIFAEYIWRFLEFGTVKMAARPHIFPTYRAMKPRIRRKMAGAVNKAVRKAKGR